MNRLSALLIAATLGFAAPAFAQVSPCDVESSTVVTSVRNGVPTQRFSVAADGCGTYAALVAAFARSMADVRNSVAIHVAALGSGPYRLLDPDSKQFIRTQPALLDADFATFRKKDECSPGPDAQCLYRAGVMALIAAKDLQVKTAAK